MKPWILLLLMFVVGCEIDTRSDNSGSDSTPDSSSQVAESSETTSETTTVAEAAAQAEWDSIRWHTSSGPSCKGAKQVMTLSAKIASGGSKVSFSWDRYPWSGMGLAHFFVWNGSGWSGGKFDWIRQGGQSTKLLENVRNGYNGLSAPPSGTRCAFAWTSSDGKQRSNLAYTTWP